MRWSTACLRLVSLGAAAGIALAARGAAGATFALNQGADTSPYSFLPTLVRGSEATLYAFTDPQGVHDFETYISFALPPDLLGPGEEVRDALLVVTYAFDFSGFGDFANATGELDCREVLEPWSEASLTWINRPDYGAPVDTVVGITALGPIVCDVTSTVAAWATGVRPNYGFALTNPTARLLGFYSFEAPVDASLQPGLVIDTGPVPEPGRGAEGLALGVLAGVWRARRTRGADGEKRGGR